MNTYEIAAKYLAIIQRAGARHSAKDTDLVQQMHDRACDLGAKCNCEGMATHPMLKGALVLRHPGHPNQKVHGNRFGGFGTTKESLRRLKGDKEAREKYKQQARKKAGKSGGGSSGGETDYRKIKDVSDYVKYESGEVAKIAKLSDPVERLNRLGKLEKQQLEMIKGREGWILSGQRIATEQSRAKRDIRNQDKLNTSPGAKAGLLTAYHPSRSKKGLPVTEKNKSQIKELEKAGFIKISGQRADLTLSGVRQAQRLLDTDSGASDFYYKIGSR